MSTIGTRIALDENHVETGSNTGDLRILLDLDGQGQIPPMATPTGATEKDYLTVIER
jgi:hypothetical protein